MEPIHLQNPVVTLTLLVCTFLYPSETTMPNFRGPTTSGRRTIDEVNDSLRKRIQRDMPWAQIHTRNGKTQESESKYIDHFIEAIRKEGGTIESFAGSQRSKDIRGVRYPGVDGISDY